MRAKLQSLARRLLGVRDAERCDACGEQSWYLVVMSWGGVPAKMCTECAKDWHLLCDAWPKKTDYMLSGMRFKQTGTSDDLASWLSLENEAYEVLIGFLAGA